jgi:hypothetical protein
VFVSSKPPVSLFQLPHSQRSSEQALCAGQRAAALIAKALILHTTSLGCWFSSWFLHGSR